jgi:hypothetical protein
LTRRAGWPYDERMPLLRRVLSAAVLAAVVPSVALAQPSPPAPTPLPPPAPPPAIAPAPPPAITPAPPLAPPPAITPAPPPAYAPPAPAPSPAPYAPGMALPPPGPTPPWLAPPPPPEPVHARPIDGVSAKGLPYAQRGGVVLDASGLAGTRSNVPLTVMDLAARVPVADRTALEVVAPIAFGAVGNPMFGARHAFRPTDHLWLGLGGAFGLPLAEKGLLGFSAARAHWEPEEFAVKAIPFAVRLGLEYVESVLAIRVQADPVWAVSIDPNKAKHFVAVQHAVEVQVGHVLGGGLRYQGVAVATKDGFPSSKGDAY